jgi:hypothetical protein
MARSEFKAQGIERKDFPLRLDSALFAKLAFISKVSGDSISSLIVEMIEADYKHAARIRGIKEEELK